MAFFEKDIEALLEAVNKVGRTIEAQAVIELQALAMYDYSLYKRIEEEYGEEEARQIHKKVWLKHVLDYINEGKEDLGFEKINDIQGLGLITKLAFEKRGCIFDIVEITPERFVGVITRDALKEYTEAAFNEKPGSPYMRSLSAASNAIVSSLVEECGLSEYVKAEQDKSIYLGDEISRIIYRDKGGTT